MKYEYNGFVVTDDDQSENARVGDVFDAKYQIITIVGALFIQLQCRSDEKHEIRI